MPFRYSICFHFASAPKDKGAARPHAGGWTEQLWSNSRVDPTDAAFDRLLTKRALFLPIEATIIGVRVAEFELAGNKIIPKGSGLIKVAYPGSSSFSTNLPQDCMKLSGGGDGTSNRVKYTARCFPDEGIFNGEWNNEGSLRTRLTNFCKEVVQNNWKTLARDLSQPLIRIAGIDGGVITTVGAHGMVINDYIRLVRVRDDEGDPVIGVFRVTAVTSETITCGTSLAGVESRGSGGLRKDALAIVAYGALAIDRVGVKKIGAPLERYVGRQSKRAV